ncbi:hypothetical protein, partial [Mycobacterium kansasii]|uniref:hypothetical protein n=1 Tax=Mycobacterium kansasii TaxID=1768 RepID=UPI001C12B46C
MDDYFAEGRGKWYVDGYGRLEVGRDFGDGDPVGETGQALVVAAPEQAVAVAAGNERSGVDIAAVCHTGV